MLIMNMDIRKEIETLATWYIPAMILMLIASGLYTGYFNAVLSNDQASIGTTLSFLTLVPALIKLTDNIVIAVWLYFMAKKEGGRKVLWLLFGLVAHLLAAIIYIGLRIYEQQAFNNPLKRDLGDASRPEAP